MKSCDELAVGHTVAYIIKNKYSVLWNYCITNVFVWENDTTSYFSACLKLVRVGKWEEFKLRTLLYVFIDCSGIFFVFFITKFVFLLFSFLFIDKVSNFCNRILTNQTQELASQNCQWNCMLHIKLNNKQISKELHKNNFTVKCIRKHLWFLKKK